MFAETRNDALVEQQQLDRLLAPTGRLAQVLGGQRVAERFGTERGEGRPQVEFGCEQQVDRTEAARIVEREAMFGGLDHEMVVLFRVGRIDSPAPAHPEVEDHRMVAAGCG